MTAAGLLVLHPQIDALLCLGEAKHKELCYSSTAKLQIVLICHAILQICPKSLLFTAELTNCMAISSFLRSYNATP